MLTRQLFSSDESRFRERAARSVRMNAIALWQESMGKVEKGWLGKPIQLDASGCPAGYKPGGYNVAFRLGVEQASKLRAFGDLKHSLTNAACVTETPIQLVSWDHLSHLFMRCCGQGRDWALFKADREAAYKQIPIDPRDQPLAIVALRDPKSGKRCGFPSHTMVFGATASALQYNAFSRLIAALANRLLGIPSYPFSMTSHPLFRLRWRRRRQLPFHHSPLLRITLNPAKSDVWPEVTFLGLWGGGWFHSASNEYAIHISHSAGKRAARSALLSDYVSRRRIASQEL